MIPMAVIGHGKADPIFPQNRWTPAMKETATGILLDDVAEGLFPRPYRMPPAGRLEPPRRASAIGLVRRRPRKYEGIHHIWGRLS